MDIETTQRSLKALSHPTRLRIVQFLSQMCCGAATVNDEGGVYAGPTAGEVCCHITGAEKISSTISHHLHELESAGLIKIERQGKRMLCTLEVTALESLAGRIQQLAKGEKQEDCCGSEGCC